MALDISVIVIYIVIINVIGIAVSRVKSVDDYFLGGRNIAWPVACFSIVATETSTLTFISIPGLAYTKGLGFLQIALGYIIGRVAVAFLLLPGYFSGSMETVYQFLQNRFSLSSRRVVAVIFHITRLLADSVRLFATAIPLALLTGMDYRLAVLAIGAATFIYTYYGGIKSVVVVDTIQLFLYIVCALIGIYIAADLIGLPWGKISLRLASESSGIITSGLSDGWKSLFGSYNIFSGIIGGALLTVGSHGTDHLIVQRVLSCRDLPSAKKAMIWSGVTVFFQFALFLVLGIFIKILLDGRAFTRPDEIMPWFIINRIPAGIKGLMLAGIFAAAMSSLSSSINSLSASTSMDILGINRMEIPDRKKIVYSRLISLVWTGVLILIAALLQNTKSPLVELGLAIASVTYGGVLGMFIMGRLSSTLRDRAALAGAVTGISAVIAVSRIYPLFWPWYVPVGFAVSVITGMAANALMEYRERREQS